MTNISVEKYECKFHFGNHPWTPDNSYWFRLQRRVEIPLRWFDIMLILRNERRYLYIWNCWECWKEVITIRVDKKIDKKYL